LKSLLNIGLGVWILLFALFLPFTYGFFPEFGVDLTNSLSGISEWIATSIFGVDLLASPATSDSAAQFVQAFLLLMFALLLGFILKKQQRFSKEQVQQFLHTGAAYILSLFLLKYGVDKLFQFQFYAPEPNTLFTPLGELSKDILFWSSMGTSSTYNTFMGLIEVVPALLLLHHRTRLLGGLIALGVLINVLMINIGFDITVKLLSMYLVILSLYIVSPFLRSLFSFFLNDHLIEKPQLRLSIKPKIRMIVKAVVVILLFTEVLFTYFKIGSFNGREMEKIEHYGSYVVSMEDSPNIRGFRDIKRIHIHSKGYIIFEDKRGNFHDFSMRIGRDHSIILTETNTPIYVKSHGSMVIFEFMREDGEMTTVYTEKINLEKLPALDDSFHWTVDGMVRDATK
jgi:hypothetical protein